jgi:acyl carrier protein phosphodiesterase
MYLLLMTRRRPALSNLSYHKFYIDELYDKLSASRWMLYRCSSTKWLSLAVLMHL